MNLVGRIFWRKRITPVIQTVHCCFSRTNSNSRILITFKFFILTEFTALTVLTCWLFHLNDHQHVKFDSSKMSSSIRCSNITVSLVHAGSYIDCVMFGNLE